MYTLNINYKNNEKLCENLNFFYKGLLKTDNIHLKILLFNNNNKIFFESIFLKDCNYYIDSNNNDLNNDFRINYDLIYINEKNNINLFNYQINIINSRFKFLKPGGIMIIENIINNELDYINKISHIKHNFSNFYFVNINNSTKILILIRYGEKIFKNNKKMTIITPSIRPNNLLKIKDSINFDYVNEWIIVYDGSKILENPNLFKNQNSKIKEYIYKGEGISGNPQRNFALDNIEIKDTYLYYLDDDNMIDINLYRLFDLLGDNFFYSFDQLNRINGNNIEIYQIDTAMVLIDYESCKDIRWILDKYNADGYYIKDCYFRNKNNWIYINNSLCTYNVL